ncbi:MAG: hypothetical protein ACLQGP_16650 [Isosphaeraceae bacterium]
MIPTGTTEPRNRLRFQLQDILAVVIGYGMAALFFRAFWPSTGLPAPLALPALVLYLWLGLALSGPIILLRRGARHHPHEPGTAPIESRTWAEWAWLFVGIYWIVLGLFVLPARLHAFRIGDALLFGMVPILVALLLRQVGHRVVSERSTTMWTHTAAVGLLATWPIAWICIIILGRRLH